MTNNLEFHVSGGSKSIKVFTSFAEASADALQRSYTNGFARIDVVTWDRDSAIEWAGEEGAEQYDEDPDATVFERLEIRVNSLGRVP